MNEWLLIIIIILLSGFFSGAEISFVSANRLRLEIRSRKNSLSSRYLNYFIRNPDTFLSTTLIGNNIVNVVYATLMALFLTGPIIGSYNSLIGLDPSPGAILIIQTFVASIVILIFGEIIPKSIFRLHSDRIMPIIATPFGLIRIFLKPLIYISNNAAEKLIRFLQPNSQTVKSFFGREDIEMLFREIGNDSQSDIDRDDSEILTNVLELSGKRVKESMVPRTDIIAVEKGSEIQTVLKTFMSSGYSRLPVYEDNVDNIIGFVIAYDLFKNPKTLDELIRPVKHVPSTQKSTDLLSEFRKTNSSVAIVIDEYGGTAGLVTIEDLIEEVVGDIQDEYDDEEALLKKLKDGSFILSGNAEIEDIIEKYPEIQLPEYKQEYETVAGYIINQTGRIPKMNEEIIIDNIKFIITKATNSRIEIVKLVLLD
ncbi:MAG: HlyC/CorC family transporter [Balneolaceae bacterium]|nr:MAG: HlyC/CorC family transporter [Balneolaceae bacterium]